MKKIIIPLLLLLTVICSINFGTVAAYADTPENEPVEEVTTYTETIPINRKSYSNVKAGEITVNITQEGYKDNSMVMILTGTKIQIKPAPGYVVKSVTLTNPDGNSLNLGGTPTLTSEKVSDGVYMLTGFEVGKDYQIDNRSDAYKLSSLTVVYENHIHTEFTRTGNKDNHWDECVCRYKTPTEAHDWDNGTVTTEPTHEANGVKTFTCSGCSVTRTEDVIPSLTDAKANVELAGALAYDGTPKTQGVVVTYGDYTLVEGTDYTVSGNVNTALGNYQLTVTGAGVFTGEVELDYTIGKGTYDMSGVVFADKTVTYNGSSFSIEATNLPDGVTVTYENNGKTNAGTYTIVAKFSGDSDNYNPIPDMTATLTVNKATYDMSGVIFADKTVTYNGSSFSIEATNLPDGVTVTYENNGKTNAGTYTIVAKFSGDFDNYNTISDMTATLTVNKATYDMSGVVFADKTVTHNGSSFSIEATNLPDGVTVTYENNGKSEPGKYTVTAKFSGNSNYNAIPDMSATLTVKKSSFTFLTNQENAEENNLENDFIVSSETGIDPDANLFVELMEKKTTSEELVKFLDKNQRIGVAYDVKLLKDGAVIQPDGTLQFKVLIPAELRGKEFEIMHIHAGTEKNILSYRIEGDYVIFETDKLSEFAFVYKTGSLVWLVIVLACLALAEAGALLYLMNKNGTLKTVKLKAAYPPFIFGMFIPAWQISCVAVIAAAVVGLAVVDVLYALKLVNNSPTVAGENNAE